MQRKDIYMFFISLLAIIIVGCNANDKETTVEKTSTEDSELVIAGEKIISTSCISCHGRDLSGDMGPGLHNLDLSDEELLDILIKGKGAMPPSTANGKETEVIAYLKSIQE